MRILSFFMAIYSALCAFFSVVGKETIIRYNDMPYAAHYERQILDLYLPKNTEETGLIMCIHGGAWCSASKDEYEPALRNYAERGYACAAINYRYCGKPNYATVNDIMDDFTAALSKIKKLAEKNGIKLKGVMFTGGSAGGHLSLLYSYSRVNESPIPVKAVFGNCAPSDFTDPSYYDGSLVALNPDKWTMDAREWALRLSYMLGTEVNENDILSHRQELYDISPIKYVTADSVPTVLCHGTRDSVIPYANSVALDALLTELGVEHELVTYTDAWHDLTGCPEASARRNALFEEYITKYL